MDVDELYRYAELGMYGSVLVHKAPVPEYPGVYRLIAFEKGNRVRVLFAARDEEDAEGYVYRSTFPTLEEAVESVEDFLGLPVEQWVNHSRAGLPIEPPRRVARIRDQLPAPSTFSQTFIPAR